MAHDKLHETCMFHTTRKRGPCKHVMSCYHVCKTEVIIERYRCHSNNEYNYYDGLSIGTPVHCELSPVTDFREACCRQYEMG